MAASPDIEKIAERGKDVSFFFSNEHTLKQDVRVDFPMTMLHVIDAECRQVGVTRQDWIKMACDERLRQLQSGRLNIQNVSSAKV